MLFQGQRYMLTHLTQQNQDGTQLQVISNLTFSPWNIEEDILKNVSMFCF